MGTRQHSEKKSHQPETPASVLKEIHHHPKIKNAIIFALAMVAVCSSLATNIVSDRPTASATDTPTSMTMEEMEMQRAPFIQATATAQANPETYQQALERLPLAAQKSPIYVGFITDKAEFQDAGDFDTSICSATLVNQEAATRKTDGGTQPGWVYTGITALHCITHSDFKVWDNVTRLKIMTPQQAANNESAMYATPLGFTKIENDGVGIDNPALFAFFLPGDPLTQTAIGVEHLQPRSYLLKKTGTNNYYSLSFPDAAVKNYAMPQTIVVDHPPNPLTIEYDVPQLNISGQSGGGLFDDRGNLTGVNAGSRPSEQNYNEVYLTLPENIQSVVTDFITKQSDLLNPRP